MDEINRLGWYQTMYPDPEIRQKAIERMTSMREGNDLLAEEWVVTTRDDGRKTISMSTSILKIKNETVHVLAVMQDISWRKRQEDEIRKNLALLKSTGNYIQYRWLGVGCQI